MNRTSEQARLEALDSYQVLDTGPEKAFDELTQLAAQICDAPVALVTLVDDARQWFKSKIGFEICETARDVAFCAYTIREKDLMEVPDAAADNRFATNPLVTHDPGIRFYAGVPLLNPEGFALGSLCVIDYRPRRLTTPQAEALRTLGRAVMTRLELRRTLAELDAYRGRLEEMVDKRTRQLDSALQRVEATYDDTLEALGSALDLRDTETAGHSRRVTRYCLEMGKRMGLSEEVLKQLGRGSYLHDIGKIGIPDAILLKPGKLTEQERAVMQTHARIGYDLVSQILFLAPAAAIVLAHQERYDGTGYPQGLRDNEIPLGARIFAVADTLDAMTSDRPYRKALSFAAAAAEIRRESGHQFDPAVVEAFLSIPEERWVEIRAASNQIRQTRARDPF